MKKKILQIIVTVILAALLIFTMFYVAPFAAHLNNPEIPYWDAVCFGILILIGVSAIGTLIYFLGQLFWHLAGKIIEWITDFEK